MDIFHSLRPSEAEGRLVDRPREGYYALGRFHVAEQRIGFGDYFTIIAAMICFPAGLRR